MRRPELVGARSLLVDLGQLRAGTVSPDALLEVICDRIEHVNPHVRAFQPEAGRSRRLRAALAGSSGPWRGVAVGVKDVIHVDGLPTTAGSSLPVSELAAPQASAVSRLLAAGTVVAGKTVTAEFAVAAPGPTANPHDLSRTPGGSSSGSAAAVASGSVPLALGTQTIGSVIRPAAYCGVVGFKTSHGRVALDGVIAHAPSLDAMGWFTATVADSAAVAVLLDDRWQPVGAGTRPPVLGVPSPAYLATAEPAGREAFARQLTALRAAGCDVRETEMFSDTGAIEQHLFVISRWELARTHDVWFDRYAEQYRAETATAIRRGREIGQADYAAAQRWRRDFVAAFADRTVQLGVDAWVAPSAPGVAPKGLASTGDSVMSFPFSLTGGPVVTVPAGRDPDGLPWGVQCASTPGCDEQVLEAARFVESVLS